MAKKANWVRGWRLEAICSDGVRRATTTFPFRKNPKTKAWEAVPDILINGAHASKALRAFAAGA